MSLEKPKLFINHHQMLIGMFLFVGLILIRLLYNYSNYTNFISKEYYFIDGVVQNSYQKTNETSTYVVLQIRSTNGLTFYTTYDKLGNYNLANIRAKIYPNQNISFWDYMGYFYTKSDIKKITMHRTDNQRIPNYISNQHESTEMKSFYGAIYLASSIPKNLRSQISKLGSSHLVALSGFHIGILWGIIYTIIGLFYKQAQKRYFPHRFILLDVGLTTLFLLAFYVWYVGAPPSLVRSFVMTLIGWAIIMLGMELFSFTFLGIATLLLLASNPSYLVSIGFFLSVLGVFYIFLLLKWCKNISNLTISMLCIPIGIFMLMLPVVHYIFGVTTPYQLLSPLLSLVFIVFYPISMLMHLIGHGGVFDSALLWLVQLPTSTKEVLTPVWLAVPYMLLSLMSIWYKKAFYLLIIAAILFCIYLYAY